MLLTAHDISMRVQHTNAQRTLDRLRALHAGYQIHVPKPVQPAELVAVVASLCGRTGPR